MYSETWPDSGTMRNGCVFERLTSERPISESESSSWPTPRATSGGGDTSAYPGAPYRPALAQLAQKWPTARGEDGESCGNHPDSKGDSLTGVTRTWSTASAHDGRRPGSDATSTQGANLKRDAETWATPDANRSSYSNGVMGPNIREQATQWNTPSTEDHKTDGPKALARYGTDDMKTCDMRLRNQAGTWQTPQSRDHRSGESLKDYGNTRPLNEQVLEVLLPAPQTPDGPQSSAPAPTSPLRLNPQFVEWLMGFPIGWSKP